MNITTLLRSKCLNISAIIVAMALSLSLYKPTQAIELGLTPSHVFGLWTNINAAVLRLETIAIKGKVAISSNLLGQMNSDVFDGKTPADVLEKLTGFRSKLDQLLARHGLHKTASFVDPEGKAVTPSVVFLNSGHVLDAIVLLGIKLDNKKKVATFFKQYEFVGKSPSAVYGLVDLANRRIDTLLAPSV